MNDRNYELVAILNGELTNEEIEDHTQKVLDAINKHDATVSKTEKWGKRRLAYAVKKSKKGYYLYIHFQSEPSKIKDIDRSLKYLDVVNRHMIVLITKKISDSSISDQNNFDEKEKKGAL